MNFTKYVFLVFIFAQTAFAQSAWQEAWHKRERTEQIGMKVLAGWSLANMAVSGIAIGQAQGSTRSFHEMNLYWNAVNLGIAGLGFINTAKARKRTAPPTLSEALEAQKSVEKVLLFNTGLDMAYVASGLWLLEKAKNQPAQQDRFRGFGQAVIVQGGFLMLFDLTNYLVHSRNAPRLQKALDHVSVTTNGVGMRWEF
jgi:hypothetical protein